MGVGEVLATISQFQENFRGDVAVSIPSTNFKLVVQPLDKVRTSKVRAQMFVGKCLLAKVRRTKEHMQMFVRKSSFAKVGIGRIRIL